MRYMIVETFKQGAGPVYARFAAHGRMLPDGLEFIESWVSAELDRCFQVMECDAPTLLDAWIRQWEDIVDFEIVPVLSSADAKARVQVSSPSGT